MLRARFLQVQLFVGNLTEELEDDNTFVKEMEAYGETVRCFVMRNPAGESKVSSPACYQ